MSGDGGSIPRRSPDDAPAPLSAAQQRFWLFERFWPGTAVYNRPTVLRLRGTLNQEALAAALADVAERHEALRTVFEDEGGVPVQIVRPAPECVRLRFADRSRDVAVDDDGLRALIREEITAPFDLRRSPTRALLVRVADDHHILAITVHHIVFDGWSKSVLLRELSACYNARIDGRVAALPDLPIQVADHAVWESRSLAGERLASTAEYWRLTLAEPPDPLALVADYPRPRDRSFRGDRRDADLSGEAAAAAAQLARRLRATPFMVHLAAFATLLHRYTGDEDLVIGCPIAGRTHVELEPLIGCFINTLPIRLDLRGDPTFAELVERVRRSALGALAHQAMPFQTLVEMLRPERDSSRPPLFQAMFNFRNLPPREVALAGLEVAELDVEAGTSLVDLALDVHLAKPGTRFSLEFDTDAFDADTAEGLLRHLACLTREAVADPRLRLSAIPLMDADEQRAVAAACRGASVPLPDRRIDELIAERAVRQPDAIAVESEEESVSYGELLRRAGALSEVLRSEGVGKGAIVAVALDRSVDLIVAMLAVLRADAAYLPLDPAYPSERLELMLRDAGPVLVLTSAALAARFSSGGAPVLTIDTHPPRRPPHTEHDRTRDREDGPAYVMYTSGSTGTPKGVVVPHRAVLNHNLAVIGAFRLQAADRVLQFASPSFDGSVEEIFPTLIAGSTLVLRSEMGHLSPRGFLDEIRQRRISVVDLPTAYWREWTASLPPDAELPDCLRLVIVGGEEATPDAYRRWRALAGPGVRWLNTYGPTEATIIATIWDPAEVPETGRRAVLPIGRPIPNAIARVVDGSGAAQPFGVPGELWIGGAGVASGYLRRPELTAERFVPDPSDPGARIYRTGDRARLRADGQLEYLGRLDAQVKIRGHRVEPGEIEAALSAIAGVREAAVRVHDGEMVAYVAADETCADESIREALRRRLPEYMIPARIVRLGALPRDASGKLDRRALAAAPRAAPAAPQTPPRGTPNGAGRMLAIWRELLANDALGPDDDFFASGGHSLLALRLVARIERELGVRLAPTELFEHPTAAALAARLAKPPSASLIVPLREGARMPFFCVHEFFGDVFIYRELANALGDDRPFFALQPPGLDDGQTAVADIPSLAARYIDAVLRVRPRGPFALGGLCAGGVIAQEMARQLRAAGHEVPVLALLDSSARALGSPASLADADARRVGLAEVAEWSRGASELSASQWRALLRIKARFTAERFRALRGSERNGRSAAWRVEALADALGLTDRHRAFGRSLREALRRHAPLPYDGPMILIRPRMRPHFGAGDPSRGWGELARGGLTMVTVPGNHLAMLQPPHVAEVARALSAALDRAEQEVAR